VTTLNLLPPPRQAHGCRYFAAKDNASPGQSAAPDHGGSGAAGHRLAGKLDATADRKAGVLRVGAIHQDVPFDATMTAAVDGEIKDLAHWLELDLVLPAELST
jgi:hypothetical protein